jgi:hypothetical protein
MDKQQLQPRSMHRAEMLLRQQQQQKQDGWKFERMSQQQFEGLCETDGFEIVYDDEQGGAWWRKEQRIARADRGMLAPRSNQYKRPVTRFGDLMSGLSRITKGLQEIDHATDGDLGESIFDLLR